MSDFQTYHFVSFSVRDVLDALEDNDDSAKAYLPRLSAMTNEEIDALLEKCQRKGFNIWTNDGELDAYELEQLAEHYSE